MTTMNIREALLTEIHDKQPKDRSDPTPQQNSVLRETALRLGIRNNEQLEQALLTEWYDLFRSGLLAWGSDLANPNPPFFHLTERARTVLQNLSRDPSNPAGYLRHLSSVATIDPVADSYLREALDCYVASLFKASAVMIGGAAERLILELRDTAVQKLSSLGRTVPKDMKSWMVKVVSDQLREFFEQQALPRDLRDSFGAYWSALAQQIRAVRNDAGHPESVDPVTPDTVHASLLVFPELAKLTSELTRWMAKGLQ